MGGRRLSVDHDHHTGLIRGILCWACNAALGKFRDDGERIVKAAEYVQAPPATAAIGSERFGPTGRIDSKARRKPRKARRKPGRKPT